MARKRRGLLTAIQVVLAVVVVGSVSWLGFKSYSYNKATQYFAAMEQTYVQQSAKGKFQVLWEDFQKDCPNAVAWLMIPGVDLSYPVMQGEDNEYYLHHDPQGNNLFAGSIFMDYENTSFNDPHVLLYGHNMLDGSMFGKLSKFKDPDFVCNNGDVYVYTPEGRRTYQVFAVQQVPATSNVFTVGFVHDEAFGQFVADLQAGSSLITEIEVDQESTVLTLSTCSSGSSRLTVSAKLVEFKE